MKYLKGTLDCITKFVVWKSKNKFNLLFTLYFNIRFLPWKQAKHLPLYFYGHPKLLAAGNGRIIIDNKKIYKGMVKINQTTETPCHSNGQTEILFKGKTIVFKGKADIRCGCRILTWGNSELIFGNNFFSGNQVSICCSKNIIFGDNVNIGHQNQIFDTSFHFIYLADTKEVYNNSAPVIIGHNSWITNRCSILKGTRLPAYSVLAAGSTANKDYSEESEGTLFVGVPAKPKKKGYYRIRKLSEENKLSVFFHNNSETKYIYNETPNFEIFSYQQ